MGSYARKKVVVIGSGVGGAGIAALLAVKGCEVLVLERNHYPGGKAASFEKEGFTFDMGVHYCARGERGPLGEINRRVGGDLRFMKPDPFMRLNLTRSGDIPVDLRPLIQRLRLALIGGIPVTKLMGAFRAISSMLKVQKESEIEPYDEMPMSEYLSRYSDDESLHKMISLFSWLLLAVPYTEASAGEFIWCFATWLNNASCSYPEGGFKAISSSYLRALERMGCKIEYDAEVRRIGVKDGRAVGVETVDRSIEADVVVSNAGIVNTIKLAGETNFDSGYVEKSLALKNSYSGVTVKYALDKKLFTIPIVLHGWGRDVMDLNTLPNNIEKNVVGEHPIIFMPIPSLADPALAPEGKQLAIACTFAPSEPEKNDYCNRLNEKLDQIIKGLFPEMKDHVIWEMRTTPLNAKAASGRPTGDAIGLAQTYNQCGKNKPSPKMPIENLYLVGCDAGGRGVGVDQAGDSALKVSEIIFAT